jgi:outer membrane protein assembly factor BamD (BamD/ComL family)
MGPRAGTRPSPVDSIPPNVNALGVSRDVNAQSTPAPTPLDISGATPDQLFVRASDARHRGDLRAAVTLYRTLERQYPEARQATLCRVLLGRILLMEEIGDPAGALAEFDAYLASSPDGTLVEEALEGRGRALERLGRANDADDAWRTLLRRFPSSIYGARARQRLGEP